MVEQIENAATFFGRQAILWGAHLSAPVEKTSFASAILDVMSHPEWGDPMIECGPKSYRLKEIHALAASTEFASFMAANT